MTLRNYRIRTAYLLRVAPWADLELIREKFTERLLKICKQPDYFTESQKEVIMAFSKGERHTVPSVARTRSSLERTVSTLYPAQRDHDRKFMDALNEFNFYFFRNDEYLGISA